METAQRQMIGEELPEHDRAPCLDCECTHDDRGCSCKYTVTSSAELRRKGGHAYRVRPVEGMGVTIPCGSDRSSGTIVRVSDSGKTIIVRGDEAIRVDSNGMSESQSYRFFARRVPGGTPYTLRKNGRWVRVGDDLHRGQGILLARRIAYYDYSF